MKTFNSALVPRDISMLNPVYIRTLEAPCSLSFGPLSLKTLSLPLFETHSLESIVGTRNSSTDSQQSRDSYDAYPKLSLYQHDLV